MGVWGYIGIVTVITAAFIIALAIASNLLTAWAAKRFADKTLEQKKKELKELLPGKDCKACGYETCEEYALAILYQEEDCGLCPHAQNGLQKKLEESMEELYKMMEKKESSGRRPDDFR